MKMIIFVLFIFAVVWFTKKYWSDYILKMFKKNTNIKNISIENETIFSPKGTNRSFVIGLDITEMGDGTVQIAIAKTKQKDV